MSAFFTFWSLAFTIFLIFIAAFVVAGMDVREEVAEQIRKAREARAKQRKPFVPVNPLAGKTVGATVIPGTNRELTARQQWVRDVVGDVARALHLPVRIYVLEDSMGHPLVHFADRKRLLTYRVDKAWVDDGMGGSDERIRFIKDVVERFLRSEWLGEADAMVKVTELARDAKAKAAAQPAAAAPAARPAAPGAAAPAAPAAAAPAGGLTREEQIAAARARAEAIKAQRAAAGGTAPGTAPSGPGQQRAAESAGKDEIQPEQTRAAGPPPTQTQGETMVDEQAKPEGARRPTSSDEPAS